MLTESSPALHGSSCANFAFLSRSTGPFWGEHCDHWVIDGKLHEQKMAKASWHFLSPKGRQSTVVSFNVPICRDFSCELCCTWRNFNCVGYMALRLATAWRDRSKISTLWCAPKIAWLHLVILAEECRGYHMYTYMYTICIPWCGQHQHPHQHPQEEAIRAKGPHGRNILCKHLTEKMAGNRVWQLTSKDPKRYQAHGHEVHQKHSSEYQYTSRTPH